MIFSRNRKVTIAGFGVEFTLFCRDDAILCFFLRMRNDDGFPALWFG